MGQISRQNLLQIIFKLFVQVEPNKNIIMFANCLSEGHTSFHIGKFLQGGRLLIWIINWAQETTVVSDLIIHEYDSEDKN